MAEIYGKQRILALLAERGIAFEMLEHPAVYTIEEMAEAGITEKGTVCKNLFLRNAKGNVHYLVTVPEERRIDLRALAEKLGSTRLSFASAERLSKYLGVAQGSVSPFGILNDESGSVIMVFDKALRDDPAVGVHPNDNTVTLWLDFAQLYKILGEHGNEIRFLSFGG